MSNLLYCCQLLKGRIPPCVYYKGIAWQVAGSFPAKGFAWKRQEQKTGEEQKAQNECNYHKVKVKVIIFLTGMDGSGMFLRADVGVPASWPLCNGHAIFIKHVPVAQKIIGWLKHPRQLRGPWTLWHGLRSQQWYCYCCRSTAHLYGLQTVTRYPRGLTVQCVLCWGAEGKQH